MKKLYVLFFLVVTSLTINIQAQTFIKRITTEYYNESYSVKQGSDHNYYLESMHRAMTLDTAFERIYKINQQGIVIDSSFDLTMIQGMKNYCFDGYIENYGDDFFYTSFINDGSYTFLYAMTFDTAFNIIKEGIIDTIQDSTVIMNHLVNKKGNHVFLIGKLKPNNWWDFYIDETDANFNLIRKINTGFKDGGCSTCSINAVGFVEMAVDSSYVLTSYKWIIKSDYNFSHIDTLSSNIHGVVITTFNNTVRLNDSIYFENVFPYYTSFPDLINYTILNKYNNRGVKKDSIMFVTPYNDNRATEWNDFMSFITPDTLFYCFNADTCVGVVKMSPSGTIFWQKYVRLPAKDYYGSIAATHDGGCILQWKTLTIPFTQYFSSIWLIKMDKDGNVASGIDENIHVMDKQILVYPNPTNDFISFETGLYENLNLQIYSVNGELQNEVVLRQGKNTFDMRKYASGLYFYKIFDSGRFVENGKFVKE